MSDVNKNLNSIIGIETPIEPSQWSNLPPPPQKQQEEKSTKKDIVMLGAPTETEVDLDESKEDFTHGREILKDLIDQGNDALKSLMEVAKASESPRAYEIVAALIKTTSETTKDLLDLHKKRKNLKDDYNRKEEPILQEYDHPQISIDRAVFVGSTRDLLQTIKGVNNASQEAIITDK